MSKNYTQQIYDCECDEGYGTQCNKKSSFVIVQNCSIYTTSIYHKRHDGEWGLYEPSQFISDPEIGALTRALNSDFPIEEKVSSDFFEYLKSIK